MFLSGARPPAAGPGLSGLAELLSDGPVRLIEFMPWETIVGLSPGRCRLRVPLSIVSAIWWVCYPFTFIEEPRSTSVATNIGHCLVSIHILSKCLDWGLFSGPQSRRKFITSSDRPGGEWVPTEKNSKSQPSLGALAGHVFSQFTSIRGLQYPWGQFSQINQNTWQHDLVRLVTCQIYSVAVVTGMLYIKIQELPSIPITQYYGWHESIPSPTVGCLVRFLATTVVMTCVCVVFETVNLSFTMLAHLTHPIVCQLGLPEVLCEFTNPIYYPPLFNNLSSFSSLSEFWGRCWHQIFRRFFLVVGVFPLTGVARGLGVSTKSQKIIGLMAAFLASGSMHAFQFYLMADSTTSTGTARFWDSFAIISLNHTNYCLFSSH
ncbi:hypothetical protein PCASD_06279 [Puccinia coronata f. sp. avenae]|uniref:Wax synthase domain-containing protein n=1 Tax=Puccinia coronata f. sp. avenae TaxID=200324 RepID=A0A2N5V6G9_9BASI|nr:hypothetical protein PCASD_06279 [Puccinia coronata f. sp. avenae]